MTALVEILRRVEECTGPDREVDADLAVRLCGWCLHHKTTWSGYQDDTGFTCDECGANSWGNKSPTGQRLHDPVPRYTASIDCALGLVERVLPGWWWKVGSCHVSDDACIGPDWNDSEHAERLKAEFGHLLVSGSEWDSGFDVDRRPSGNVALALIEALLSALIAIEEARAPAKEVAG